MIPLQMVAAGFTSISFRNATGLFWLPTAAIVARVATGFLWRAEGFRLNRLKSGELRNRAFKMADQMGVAISRVYMVPAGKGHLLNAFGMSHAVGLTDSVGKYFRREEIDCLIAHELAHVKLKHVRKDLLLTSAVFTVMAVLVFFFSAYMLSLGPVARIAVIFLPLISIYYFSRRSDYAADRVAVEFTSQPEIAIRALLNSIALITSRRMRTSSRNYS